LTVQNVSFRASPGTVIGIIGPSASGKSSLERAISGVWAVTRGRIRLDGASLDQWPEYERGRHIGYMPQSSDLFPGTIAHNIARLDRAADHNDIIAATCAAGVHEMIVALPDGYETDVGDSGVNLSAGQRQRVALARALYGEPFLVILDEPSRVGRVSLCGDEMMRTLLYEAAQVILTVVRKWSWLKAWAMNIAKRRGHQKAIVALARRLAVIMHRIWSDGTQFQWSKSGRPAKP
jgi:ABC-type protease/lipase transport system fused ATPase/permease subunit